MKERQWIIGWFVVITIFLLPIGYVVYSVDPFFHYHKPYVEKYYYKLDNQRSQNNGISKNFDYDTLITGTSMTEMFKVSEINELFGVNAIKVPYSGGSYKEINENVLVALEHNPSLSAVIRCLDYGMMLDDKDKMREDLGAYPTYLYDENPLNDVEYLFNGDVIFDRVYPMISQSRGERFVQEPGITSFDDYSRWADNTTYGRQKVIPDGIKIDLGDVEQEHLSQEERFTIKENILKNVTLIADKYPNVKFYYFFSPYSAIWWHDVKGEGKIYKYIESEEYIIELILEHPNILLFSFNDCFEITTNLNNYTDKGHYGPWVNSFILNCIYTGNHLLTKDNYKAYLQREKEYYMVFDYSRLNSQIDYFDDYYAEEVLERIKFENDSTRSGFEN